MNRSSRKLRAAIGTEINIIGEWRTTVTMGPLRVGMNFIVSDQIDELLVGIDWLRENECVLSFADSTIELKGYRFRLLKKTKTGTSNRVILEENVTLPAKSEMIVSGKVVYADLHKRTSESLITGNKECRPVVVTNKDVALQDGTCDVANEIAYIISRRRLLGSQVLQRALLILILIAADVIRNICCVCIKLVIAFVYYMSSDVIRNVCCVHIKIIIEFLYYRYYLRLSTLFTLFQVLTLQVRPFLCEQVAWADTLWHPHHTRPRRPHHSGHDERWSPRGIRKDPFPGWSCLLTRNCQTSPV